jgi:predicted glycosyltransferase involved in capsule biosynthesis
MSLLDELKGPTEPYQEYHETDMPFSIIIPWRSGNPIREESFKNMMRCLAVQQSPASKEKITCEVIVIEQPIKENRDYARTVTDSLVPDKIKNKMYPFHNYRYIQLINDNYAFNKSWCMNVGARLANFDHLIFVDADTIMGHDFIRTIRYEIKRIPKPKNMIVHLWNYLLKLHGKDEPIDRWVRPDITRAMGGIWYANKYFYWQNFGGMNETYWGYGGEDNDAFERAVFAMQQVGSSDSYPFMVHYPLAHQYHDNEPQSPVVPYWLKARSSPQEVISRLRGQNLGDIIIPHPIKMDDLKD